MDDCPGVYYTLTPRENPCLSAFPECPVLG